MPDWLIVTLCVVGGFLVLVVVVGSRLPRAFTISRSIVIAAPPDEIHPFVNSFRNWPRWSSFDTADPDARFDTPEPSAGVGAKRTWKGRRMGNGSQWIVASDPRKGVSMKLDTTHMEHTFDFEFVPDPGGTRVTWSDRGEFPPSPLWRLAGNLFLQSMLGGMFEKGLADLKRVVEQSASPQ
jgi:polyketide cyclase/dehydrase/lipid transport protein